MSSKELTGWIAYFELEPFGYEMDNYRTGVIASTVANSAGRKKPLVPSDFFLTKEKIKPDSPNQLETKLKTLASLFSK